MKVVNTYIVRHICSYYKNNRAIIFETEEGLFYAQYRGKDGEDILEIQEDGFAKEMIKNQ